MGIRSEIERDPSIKHAIITYQDRYTLLGSTFRKNRTSVLCRLSTKQERSRRHLERRMWCGLSVRRIVRKVSFGIAHRFCLVTTRCRFPTKKRTHPMFTAMNASRVFMNRTLSTISLKLLGIRGWILAINRKVVLITSFPLPGITDKPEVLLFDWTDFEVAGSLEKLPEAIATRKRFEAERAALTADSSREEVERVFGCSSRQANRILKKLRGGDRSVSRSAIRFSLISPMARKRQLSSLQPSTGIQKP